MAVGVVPFAVIATYHPLEFARRCGAIVYFNGVLTHGATAVRLPWADKARAVDIACNVVLTSLVNVRSQTQPDTLFLTCIAAVMWQWSRREPSPWHRALVHILGVQLVLASALSRLVLDIHPDSVLKA